MQDVRDPMEIRARVRDAVLERATVRVWRPEGCPPDTVAAFLVSSDGLVHWYGVKRPWRHMGLGQRVVALAESLSLRCFARFGGEAQKRWLEERGWRYRPRAEVLLG